MRKLIVLMTAVLAIGAAATPAAATPLTWNADPGGDFTASGPVDFAVSGSTFLSCTVILSGVAPVGPTSGPLAVFPAIPGPVFDNCSSPFGLATTITQVGDWYMNGSSSDPVTDLVTGTLDNFSIEVEGPACDVTAIGSLNYVYSNTSGVMDVLPDETATVSVDPVNNCLGLISDGEHGGLDASLQFNPIQRFTSP